MNYKHSNFTKYNIKSQTKDYKSKDYNKQREKKRSSKNGFQTVNKIRKVLILTEITRRAVFYKKITIRLHKIKQLQTGIG